MVFGMFSDKMQALIARKGFIEPTLPQKLGIPDIYAGKNVLIIAATGIGKTETAMLPLLDKIHTQQNKPISLLYITPLKSLNRDLMGRLFWWADKLDLQIDVRHGDTSQADRAAQRENPPHALIVTPESLQAIMTGKIFREHLKNVKYVVIDEIHELIESKRGVQLSLGLERLRQLAGNFQRIGLSATVGSPEIVADFLAPDTKIIRAESAKKYNIRVENPKPTPKDQIIADDLVIGVNTTARLRRLYELIQSHKSVIAFTNTRETAEVISSRLKRLDRELKQEVHHGSLSKEGRIKSEVAFKEQRLKSLIATSSLELGIDIGSIDLVVQYLSPRQATRLIQRVGRAGHRIDEVSKGIVLSGEEDIFESCVVANHASNRRLDKIRTHDMALDVLSGQILGMCLDEYEVTPEKVFEITKGSYMFRDITREQIDILIKFMADLRLVWMNPTPEGSYTIKRRRKTWTSYFENLSTIPAAVKFRVISVIENEPIGSLDEAFVAEHGQSGNKFICAGRAWKIIQVDGPKVIVEPVDDIESAIPSWEGELIPVSFDVAQEVGKLRKLAATGNVAKIREFYNTDAESAKEMASTMKQHMPFPIPDNKNVLIENYKDFIIIHTCAGSLVNDTLGRYLAAIITNETGVAVNMKNDPYRIILQTVVDMNRVKDMLEEAEDIKTVLTGAIERSSMFKWRFLHVARRFGVISREAKFDKINMNKIVTSYAKTPIYEETLRELFLEKMNLENAALFIESVRKGEAKLHIKPGLSYLGEIGLSHQFKEVMKPRMPEKEILNAFRKRLLMTRVRLLCTNCGDYNLITKVKDVEEQPACPKCHSRLIAVISKRKISAGEVVKKRSKKKPLTEEEQKELQNVRRSADLVMIYGKRAAEVLAGHGIGPQTAARILSMLHTDKEKFYKDILAAEKQFAKTRIYWK
ncbi:MAG: ATP-dependent helicase Lhr and Lhr-like protein helicase [archaeon GW2011_AR5]|nr:MAG: ATP-dependent helicase Lhr and Lhr-like protein helicase [archaeon GW2011_AR5]